MPVRAARRDDLDEICSLIRELAVYERLEHAVVFSRDEMEKHLFGPEPKARVTIAETDDGDVAGFALYFETFSTFLGRPGIWLEDLFVRPAYRKLGLGVALLSHLRTLTDGRIEWSVLDWNQPSIDFYRALGADPVVGWTTYRWPPTDDSTPTV